MPTDCEVLSSDAEAIFKKLEPYFPSDPWKKPRWQEEGTVRGDELFDLRKGEDRDRLIRQTLSELGSASEIQALIHRKKDGSLEGFDLAHFGKMVQQRAELLLLLRELDFQIETGDALDT
jgi:hypothetical protein